MIIPQVGYAGMVQSLTVVNNSGSQNFNQGLASGNASIIYNRADMLNLGISLVKHKPEKTNRTHYLKVGYNFAFKNNDWVMLSATTTNTPADKLSHFFIQYGWGLVKQK